MEDPMRKSILPVAIAIISTISFPAHAAKYTCTFSQGSSPIGSPCNIDPTTTATSCQQSLGGNLLGLCAAGKSEDDKQEALLCVFGVPETITDAAKGLGAQNSMAAVGALAQKPGFAAQNYTVFATQTRPLLDALLYRETQTSPVFAAACQ
jgi:hypothetical protein